MQARKKFREWTPNQYVSTPLTPAEILPEDDLVFFLIDLVPQLDLAPICAHYERETRGAPPFDVAMMTTLLLYSYCVGVFSSRKIAGACERTIAFLAIVGNHRPDFRSISDFRKIHLGALTDLFVEVLQLAGELGMVKLGNLSLDGSKVRANASRHKNLSENLLKRGGQAHFAPKTPQSEPVPGGFRIGSKAMSYGYMKKEVERLRAEIAALLRQCEQTDAEQDAALGPRRGDELPEELARREARLEAIEQAMDRLEQEAQEKADAQRREREQAKAERQARGEKRRGREPKPISDEPDDKAQTNFTDPDAKIMKTSNKGFDYCFNGQAVVDEEAQIIVGAEVTAAANDKQQATPLGEQTKANLQAAGTAPPATEDEGEGEAAIPLSADTGYFSETNVEDLESQGFDPYIATGRQKHSSSRSSSTDGSEDAPGEEATAKERMSYKLRTPSGRARYAKRKHIVEPVFGQIKQARGFRQFLLRGLEKVRCEWKLVCLTHNLLKIWRYRTAPS